MYIGDLMDGGFFFVYGEGGKCCIVLISDYLVVFICDILYGYLFFNGIGGFFIVEYVGKFVFWVLFGDVIMYILWY